MKGEKYPIRWRCTSCGDIRTASSRQIMRELGIERACRKCNRGELRPYMTGWILRNSVRDVNFKSALPRLTDDELKYCLANDTRKTGIRELEREQRRREN